jgi:sulfonate transport system substrate-binding protein
MALLVVPFLAGSLVACGGSGSKDSITIGTFSKALGNTPYYVAKHLGWFEDDPALQDVEITYAEYNDRPTIASALSRGELDFLFSAEAPAILIRAQGEDIRAVVLSTTASQEVLVPAASALSSPEDLRGKRVAVLAGTSSHYGLLKILSSAGMSDDDVNLQFMGPAEAKTAFETGELDAWSVWAPWVEMEEVSGQGRAMLGGNAVIHSVGSMPVGFIENREAIARALVKGIQRAKTWMEENPTEAQRIASEQLGLDLAVVERAWPKFDWSAEFDSAVKQDIQEKADFLSQQEVTRGGGSLNVEEEFLDGRFLH